MTNTLAFCFAVSLALLAVLYQVEVLTTRWEAEEFAIIPAERGKIWKLVTDINTTSKWFQWVPRLQALDSRPLGVGKRFEAIYNIPIIGEYALPLQVTQFSANRLIVIESSSLLKPKMTLFLQEKAPEYTKVVMKVEYKRNSALFRCTLGPLSWLLTSQQLRHSLFILKMLFPA